MTLTTAALCAFLAPPLRGFQPVAETVQSSDTRVSLRVSRDSLVLSGLSCHGDHRNWAGGNNVGIALPASAQVGGKEVSLSWKLVATKREGQRAVTFSFTCLSLGLSARSVWTGGASGGPIEHLLTIENRERRPVELPNLNSLRWAAPFVPGQQHWWVEKGAGRPSNQGVHCDAIGAGFDSRLLSRPYVDDAAAYSADGAVRDPIPWICVYDPSRRAGWYAGLEYSGRATLSVSVRNGSVQTSLGLDADPKEIAFQTRLAPGELHEYPAAFVGCFDGNVDDGANQLKRWVDTRLRPPTSDSRYPLLTMNSWGSGMAIDEALGLSMANNAKRLGLEMFHVDAGWFRRVGDWRPNPTKFPDGIGAFADEIHNLGLKFGLWVGWTQGGTATETDPAWTVNVHSPTRRDWFTQDYPANWQPQEFVGADLCLGSPEAVSWSIQLLDRLVSQYKIDMLEHDQRMIVDTCSRTDHLHTSSPSDVAYRATEGYYKVYDTIRRRHPNLMFEDCVNGGRMVDFGAAKRVHYFSITDSYDPLSNRRAFWDTSYVMPPSMCECYVMKMPVQGLAEFKAMLRSGMMGWFTLMQNPAEWTAEQFAAAQSEFETYKTKLRPFIRYGSLYHLSERPDGIRWDAVQFAMPDGSSSVLYAFRGTGPETSHSFRLDGLVGNAIYRIHLQDGDSPDTRLSGKELMATGLAVQLSEAGSSQIVFLDRVSGGSQGSSQKTQLRRRGSLSAAERVSQALHLYGLAVH